jgi:hypothetical protein
MIPLALATWAIVVMVVAIVLVVIAAPLRLWWRLRQGDDEPQGSYSSLWRRNKRDTPEDYE